MLPLMLLIALAAGTPDEAKVSKVVDGDTFDVTLQEHDSRISENLIRIRLTDIDTPKIRGPKACEAGKKASAYTRSWLLGTYIFLDLDDKAGKDQYGRWVAVAFREIANERLFLMKDLAAVEEAVGLGAKIVDGEVAF